MTANKIIFLCCLPALFGADPALAMGEEVLVVGPGDEIRLQAPEAGARLEAAIGGGPLAPAAGSLAAPGTGDHWLTVASRDPAGNLSPIRWIRLRVDGEPPRVELRTEPEPVDGLWIPPATGVGAAASDPLAGTDRLFLAVGEEVREVTDATVSGVLPRAEGKVAVRAWAVDRVGNRSAESALELAIDATPPAGGIRAVGPRVETGAGIVLPPFCRIEVGFDDAGSGLASQKVRIDGEEAELEALAGPWAAGDHAVEAIAADRVGNETTVGPFRFTVDAAGPEIAWRVVSAGAEGAGGEIFYRPPVAVEARAMDALAGHELLQASTDGETYRRVAGAVEVDGEELLLRATDRVGNVTEARASWSIDRRPPEIRLETEDGQAAPAGGTLELSRGASVRPRATDPGAGVERATYSLKVESADVGRRWWWFPPENEPLPEEIVFPWAGRLTLEVEATDRLGHRSTARWNVVVRKGGGS